MDFTIFYKKIINYVTFIFNLFRSIFIIFIFLLLFFILIKSFFYDIPDHQIYQNYYKLKEKGTLFNVYIRNDKLSKIYEWNDYYFCYDQYFTQLDEKNYYCVSPSPYVNLINYYRKIINPTCTNFNLIKKYKFDNPSFCTYEDTKYSSLSVGQKNEIMVKTKLNTKTELFLYKFDKTMCVDKYKFNDLVKLQNKRNDKLKFFYNFYYIHGKL